ncbi:MAG: sigma 54-interacting transcriptional regulator [Pseudomonadota bacterium]
MTDSPDKGSDAVKLELELAREASNRGDYDLALNKYAGLIRRLGVHPHHEEHGPLFVTTVLEFSNLAMLAGKALKQVFSLLQTAGRIAEGFGDRRSQAMILLHIGRILFIAGREPEALAALEKGTDRVTELGDPDILEQASVFIGFYHFIKGHHKVAMEHLERSLGGSDEMEGMQFRPMARIVFGYTAAFIGHFHRSIGTLAFSYHLAKRKRHPTMASIIGAVLGIVLLAAGKLENGRFHLETARQNALDTGNRLGLNIAIRGLAYYHFLEGRLEEATHLVATFETLSAEEGFSSQLMTPWLLEMLTQLERLGLAGGWRWRFEETFDRIMKNPNIHIQGVALRLRSEHLFADGSPTQAILPLLILSEERLLISGDPAQLAKCRFARALLHERDGDADACRQYARKGYREIAGYDPSLCPDALRPLLDDHGATAKTADQDTAWVTLLIGAVDRLTFKTGTGEFLNRLLFVLNRFLQDERAGVFWMTGSAGRNVELRAARNLTREDIGADIFAGSMAIIRKTLASGSPLLTRFDPIEPEKDFRKPHSMLCLPIAIEGTVRGVLYQDKTYLDSRYRRIDGQSLLRITDSLSAAVTRSLEYNRLIEETRVSAIETTVRATLHHDHDLLARSPEMIRILGQAEKVAGTDASILLLGETGTGKEVMARWIHENSPRRDKPFIVIEPAVIPENLVESELFGHERGAFTGADHQKTGLVELAHGGTLFIDEVGEIPGPIQVKLLRLLQEKAFNRVGGTKTIGSDFRLLAATNRDLHQLVAAGRFREDLYYRINVMELRLPPLRERGDDIIFLASHFLSRCARKYNRTDLTLSKGDEKRLAGYHWPGNVRELQNVMERAVLLSAGSSLKLDLSVMPPVSGHGKLYQDLPSMDEMQWRYIQYVIQKTGGQIGGRGGAAQVLGMKRTTLQARMKKLERLVR